MDKTKVILFYDLCRLCLENPGTSDMFTADLVHDIFLCTGVKVSSQDNLPHKICMQCLEIVVKAKQLRILASANETQLISLFNDDQPFTLTTDKVASKGPNEEKAISRKSSTDSDRSGNLMICEDEIVELDNNISSKRRNSSSSEHSNSEAKKLVVRTDLFHSSRTVTSSTADVTPTEHNSKVKFKRRNSESVGGLDFECEVCRKKFDTHRKLYLHQRTHSKNIICPLDACGKKFAIKGDLEKHIRTHTGERPFRCNLCERSFTQRGTLKVHRKTMHERKVKAEDIM